MQGYLSHLKGMVELGIHMFIENRCIRKTLIVRRELEGSAHSSGKQNCLKDGETVAYLL